MKKIIILSMIGFGTPLNLLAADNINNRRTLEIIFATKGASTFRQYTQTLQEKAVDYVCKDERSYNLRRYQPTNKEIARAIYTVLTDVAAQAIAVHMPIECNNYNAETKKSIKKSLPSIMRMLLDVGTRECLYRLVAAEIHKNEKLAKLRSWFPASNAPADEPTKEIDVLKQFATDFLFTRAYVEIRNRIASKTGF